MMLFICFDASLSFSDDTPKKNICSSFLSFWYTSAIFYEWPQREQEENFWQIKLKVWYYNLWWYVIWVKFAENDDNFYLFHLSIIYKWSKPTATPECHHMTSQMKIIN